MGFTKLRPGFCADEMGDRCDVLYERINEGLASCQQRCTAIPKVAGSCRAVEYWRLGHRMTLCRLCRSAAHDTNLAPASNVDCYAYTPVD